MSFNPTPPNAKSKELLLDTITPSNKNMMCILVPANGTPARRIPIDLINITDEGGTVRHWPDGRQYWGSEAMRTTRALFVTTNDPIRPFANGLYLVFSGTVHSGLPVNINFANCRFGVYGDVIILKPVHNEPPGRKKPEYKHVPEELLYPATFLSLREKIDSM